MDIKDNVAQFKPREKAAKLKTKKLKGISVDFSVTYVYEDESHDPEAINGHHEITLEQLFSMPQGPMFLMAHMFDYMHRTLFVRCKEHLQTLFSNEELGLQEEQAQQAQHTPGPQGLQ